MTAPLMPKATAVWLIENTALTFNQIANFCGIHILEVQTIADSEKNQAMVGFDPIASGQLSLKEIQSCEQDPKRELKINTAVDANSILGKKKTRYTPLARRQERPDAIAWLVKYYSHLSDTQVMRLIGTTKATIKAVREKSHWNAKNIKPRSPVQLGFCTQTELEKAIQAADHRTDKKKEHHHTPEEMVS